MRGYEEVFQKASHGQRLFVLQVFALAGDAKTCQFLKTCGREPKYSPETEEIRKVLQVEPRVRFAALKEASLRPSEAWQLDQLWAEFFVTGSTRPVLAIIDVLERPDRLRGKLQAWLQSNSVTGGGPLTESDRARVCQRLTETAGIAFDQAKREIENREDLDVRSVLKDWQMSRDRFQAIERVLPFPLTNEDKLYIALKASAAWSLASNAAQHGGVFQTCVREAEKRTGHAKLTLLEIAGRRYANEGE